MKMFRRLAALAVVAAFVAVGCSGGTPSTAPATKIKLQLQWFPQAQFAGYFAAKEKGFYLAEGLDVEILAGGVDIVPANS